MIETTLGAEIKEGHGIKALVYAIENYYHTRIQKLPVGKYQVTIKSTKAKRSDNQNRYYWGVVLPLIEEETGNLAEDIHEYAKRKFLPPKFITVKGEQIKIPRSTTSLTKAEFVEYLMKLEAWSGVHFPSPEEAGYISNSRFIK